MKQAIETSCPHCGAVQLPTGELACGSTRRRHRWLPWRWVTVRSHQCASGEAERQSCMLLIAAAINSSSQARTWQFADVAGPAGCDFGDWYITVGRKAERKGSRLGRPL